MFLVQYWYTEKHVKNVQIERLALSIYADDAFTETLMITFPSLPFFFSSLPGHGPHQHALCAPHGWLWGLLHRSAHPAANLRCLLEVRAHLTFLFPPSIQFPSHTLCQECTLDFFYLTFTSRPPLSCKMQFACVLSSARTTTSDKCFKYSRGS